MILPDISITEAEKALAQLQASTGIDLRGYGHIFGVADEIMEERLARLRDGEIAFLLGGAWLKVPRVLSLSVDHQVDEISMGALGDRHDIKVRGLQTIEISLETEWDDVTSPALIDRMRESAKIPMRMGAADQILEADVFWKQYESEIGPHGIVLRIEMTVSGQMAVN